jgi:hypothetical protein
MKLMLALLALAAVAGCKKERPIDGIGPYRFGRTQLKDWNYDCNPPDKKGRIYCQSNPLEKNTYHLGEHNKAEIAGTFYSSDRTAPLAELELFVAECNVDRLKGWLDYTFGSPASTTEQKMFWKKGKVFIAAKVPPGAVECVITMVESTNAARIAELENPPASAAPPAP